MKPYALLAAVVLWALSLVGVGAWQYAAGQTAERLTWSSAQSAQLQTALATNSRLEKQARADEARHGAELVAIAAGYQQRLSDEQVKNGRLAAALRSGAVRLRQPAGGVAEPGGGVGAPGAGTGRGDGAANGELSGASAEFLFSITAEADAVAVQLDACQQVVRADRRLCGAGHE